MNYDVKYSVIIPAYNAELTLKRCLDSLLSQKRQDVQIIVINDGSTDGTAKILDNYSSVTAIAQTNKGVSAARNCGLEAALGEYVLFVDSDDYVSEDYFDKLDMMSADYDLCCFRRSVIGGKQLAEEHLFHQVNECLSWTDQMKLLLASREIMQLYNKRFKRDIIEQYKLRFIESLYSTEDFNFCLAYSMQCKTIQMYQAEIYCNDLFNQESLSRKVRKDLTEQLVNGFQSAAVSIWVSRHRQNEKQLLLTELDYLYAKCVCSCIAETFKYKKPAYFSNRIMYQSICCKFRQSLTVGNYKNLSHRCLRVLLKYQINLPIYLITLFIKGRSARNYRMTIGNK